VPVRPRRAPDAGQEVPSARAGSLPARGCSVHSGRARVPAAEREAPPSWWALEMPEEWRRSAWAHFPAEIRNQILAERAGRPAPNSLAAADGSISSLDPLDAAALWSVYYALKALAERLDAGLGTEGDRIVFERWLQAYDRMFERVRSRRPLL
jgi:hypothetical protein